MQILGIAIFSDYKFANDRHVHSWILKMLMSARGSEAGFELKCKETLSIGYTRTEV